ncbi:MAG TPA: DoxX family protein [Chitinophagaceae bacterium]|nr:DoxX family protein [Chitinophagaceae bacterium]
MKKFLNTTHSEPSFSIALLVLRISLGALMIPHGYQKLISFAEKSSGFTDPFHIGSATSLSLVIFAEFFCAIFIMIGLATRFSAIPLIIAMAVAVFHANHGDIFGGGEKPALYLFGFIALLFTGPGKISLDYLLMKKKN